ncbi:integrase [Silvimonas terrae]|uniref:Integrase n=1 Tax=Silvimonas terrae TaxID=300266 RepID=A0A840RCH0_9NEIS|nr:tyrosine-type recombinase/integrase [Silvimonas terrae]MBB5190083.1 integrase [Silvimonas terrae]
MSYCANLRGEILRKIQLGTFNYGEYFPESKRARLFGHGINKVLISTLLDEYVALAEKTIEHSSLRGYMSAVTVHWKPAFGNTAVQDLTPADIRNYLASLSLTLKSVRNILTPLRAVLDQAVNDDLITRNPLDRVVVAKLVSKENANSDYQVDPFDEIERNAIIAAAKGPARNLIQFAFFSGVRSSELLALEWGDVDWLHGVIRVQRALVYGKEKKRTKTAAGMRDIMLLPAALAALQDQKQYTYLAGKRIFCHPITQDPLLDDEEIRRQIWIGALRKAGVRYRNPYQTRHTYASMLLSAGENLLWVASQMGHVDTEMLIKTYGKWIPDRNAKAGYKPVADWSLDSMKIAQHSHNGTKG